MPTQLLEKPIALEGAFNFRDIGGLKTIHGKQIKSGLHYRSDELSKLTDQDIAFLKSLNIQTVIDYRSAQERQNNENKDFGQSTYYIEPIADLAALASAEFKDLKLDDKRLDPHLVEHLMIEQNKEFVRNPICKQAFRQMFDVLLVEENLPNVQHCRGGKDRTGFGVALLLGVLEVPRQAILEDYLLTNVYKKEKNERSIKEIYEKTGDEQLVQAMRYFKEANLNFINTALDMIDSQYGSIKNYCQKELYLSDQEIQTLEDLYLEEGEQNL